METTDGQASKKISINKININPLRSIGSYRFDKG